MNKLIHKRHCSIGFLTHRKLTGNKKEKCHRVQTSTNRLFFKNLGFFVSKICFLEFNHFFLQPDPTQNYTILVYYFFMKCKQRNRNIAINKCNLRNYVCHSWISDSKQKSIFYIYYSFQT